MRERKYFRMRSDMAQGIGFFGKREVSCSVCKLLFFSLLADFLRYFYPLLTLLT